MPLRVGMTPKSQWQLAAPFGPYASGDDDGESSGPSASPRRWAVLSLARFTGPVSTFPHELKAAILHLRLKQDIGTEPLANPGFWLPVMLR